MRFIAQPLHGVNIVEDMAIVREIEFGYTSDIIKRILSIPVESGDIRAVSKKYPTDYILDASVFFYYSLEGLLEAVEFCDGVDVTIGGFNPLGARPELVIEFLRKLDPNLRVDHEGARSYKLDLAIYCPLIGNDEPEIEEDNIVKTFLIGRKGFWEHYDKIYGPFA